MPPSLYLIFTLIEYLTNGSSPTPAKSRHPQAREARVKAAEATIFALLNDRQKEFIAFVMSKSIETGVDELDQEKLPILLVSKYQSREDASGHLGEVASIKELFIEFQEHLDLRTAV